MSRQLLTLVFLSCGAILSLTRDSATPLASREQCLEEHRAWVAEALQKMQTIRPGMTRKDLLEVFRTEGGYRRDCGGDTLASSVRTSKLTLSSMRSVDLTV